jgi:hypothetical protein
MGKWPEHMAKIREFLSLEQALQHAIKNLSDEDLISTKKKKEDFRRYSDPDKPDRNISHIDSIDVDVACMKKGKGHPLLSAHEALLEKALKGQNNKESITHSLLTMGERLGKLMGETEKAMDPSSPGGSALTKEEKDNLYKAIKEVEEKIASFKKSIE